MNLTKTGLSYGIHEYRPHIEFSLKRGREMFGFGKWMFLSSILMFLYGQGDDAFVGWFFTAAGLGYYQLSYRFSNAPATEITHVISRVAFPTFSKIQDDVERLRNGFFTTIQLSTVVAFPMAAGIAAVSQPFVTIFLGPQWSPMVPLLQILSIWGGLRALGANLGSVFKSKGRPDIEVWTQAIQVLVIAVVIIPASEQFGIVGVGIAVISGSIAILIPQFHFAVSLVDGGAGHLLTITTYPLIASLLMFLGVSLVDTVILEYTILNLCGLILTGVIIYLVLIWLIQAWTNYSVTPLMRRIAESL
jgi:O-antigen/teichoic acid export membrane protein